MNKLENILVVVDVEERHKKILESVLPNARFTYLKSLKGNEDEVKKADVIIGNPPPKLLAEASNLKLLQLESAGTGVYINDGVLPKGAFLANSTGAYGLAISEYMVSVALMLYKKLHLYRDNQLLHEWKDEGRVKSIEDSTTLVVGLGDIGGEFAKRMKKMGSHTIGIKRTIGSKPDYLDELYTMDSLNELLPKADIVAVSLPETKATIKLFNKEKFGLMKNGAVFLNVGRGTLVETDDLCDAVENGKILGAGVDVTDPEPLPKEHRLWDIKGIFVTPHISGGHHLIQTLDRIVDIAAKNLGLLNEGKELENLVDFQTGYKKSK